MADVKPAAIIPVRGKNLAMTLFHNILLQRQLRADPEHRPQGQRRGHIVDQFDFSVVSGMNTEPSPAFLLVNCTVLL